MRSRAKNGAAVFVIFAVAGCSDDTWETVRPGGVGGGNSEGDSAGVGGNSAGVGGGDSAGVGGAGCPQASGGPGLVAVAGGYCIDATEVTRDQYAAKLESLSLVEQPAECLWNNDFKPDTGHGHLPYGCDSSIWPPGAKGSYPAVCVDWCDAYAYCKAVGKRLCGKIGGGKNLWADSYDPTKSQWYNVCSSGGVNEFPYGDAYSGKTCNGVNAQQDGPVAVGTMSGCVSQGVFDLSGNVWEWEDSCSADSGKDNVCRLRGGSSGNDIYYLRCSPSDTGSRYLQRSIVGFRCCAP